MPVHQGRAAARRLGLPRPSRTRTLDAHAARLRTKLRAAGQARWVDNVWGVGYRLAPVGCSRAEPSAA